MEYFFHYFYTPKIYFFTLLSLVNIPTLLFLCVGCSGIYNIIYLRYFTMTRLTNAMGCLFFISFLFKHFIDFEYF